jgi:hypothetical protein
VVFRKQAATGVTVVVNEGQQVHVSDLSAILGYGYGGLGVWLCSTKGLAVARDAQKSSGTKSDVGYAGKGKAYAVA